MNERMEEVKLEPELEPEQYSRSYVLTESEDWLSAAKDDAEEVLPDRPRLNKDPLTMKTVVVDEHRARTTTVKKRKYRSSNYSQKERQLLMELVDKYQHIIENKKTDSVTVQKKERCWQLIAWHFNARSRDCRRDWKQLRTCLQNIKRKVKGKYSVNLDYSNTESEQSIPSSDDVSARVIELFPEKFADLSNPNESDTAPRKDLEEEVETNMSSNTPCDAIAEILPSLPTREEINDVNEVRQTFLDEEIKLYLILKPLREEVASFEHIVNLKPVELPPATNSLPEVVPLETETSDGVCPITMEVVVPVIVEHEAEQVSASSTNSSNIPTAKPTDVRQKQRRSTAIESCANEMRERSAMRVNYMKEEHELRIQFMREEHEMKMKLLQAKLEILERSKAASGNGNGLVSLSINI